MVVLRIAGGYRPVTRSMPVAVLSTDRAQAGFMVISLESDNECYVN
jgi:hypothetical protein